MPIFDLAANLLWALPVPADGPRPQEIKKSAEKQVIMDVDMCHTRTG